MTTTGGKVYLIGAGPGDDGLLTVRGRELIGQAEVILYDRLASPALLLAAGESCEKISVGKREGCHSFRQEEINALLIQKAKEGKTVVRLKGGDSFVFGRGGEEILALETEGIPYEVVPGVTSAIGALAAAGIPVTHRGAAQSFHVITGHTKDDEMTGQQDRFAQYACLEGTLIFLMGVSRLAQIATGLLTNGKAPDTPAAIVEQGGTIRQRRIDATLGTIVETAGEKGVKPPAILVVGASAACHMCSERLPLAGVKIGVTGTRQMTEKLEARLREQGAVVYKAPYIQIISREQSGSPARPWERCAWLVFTSSNGVRCFFRQFYHYGGDIRGIAHHKFAVVGSGTRRTLYEYGIRADFMPDEYTVEALAKGLASIVRPHERVCVLRAAEGSAALRAVFDRGGIQYDDIPIYDTVTDVEILDRLYEQLPFLDYLTFASASGVNAFLQKGRQWENRIEKQEKNHTEKQTENQSAGFRGTIVCIGDQTRAAFGAPGFHIAAADCHTAEGVTEAILQCEKEVTNQAVQRKQKD